MIIGDEYVYLRAVAGGLPPHLEGQLMALPPAAFTRLQRSLERPRALQAPRRGAITRSLDQIPPKQRRAILDPCPELCIVLNSADLAAIVLAIIREARQQGIPITPYTADLIASAHKFDLDTVYAGHARNIPRLAQSESQTLGVRWKLIDLA